VASVNGTDDSGAPRTAGGRGGLGALTTLAFASALAGLLLGLFLPAGAHGKGAALGAAAALVVAAVAGRRAGAAARRFAGSGSGVDGQAGDETGTKPASVPPGDLEGRLRATTAELAAVRAELEETSRRSEEADRLKSLFIANMSHEIRTPLNSVLALSQLLRDGVAGPLTVDQRRYLEVIERNGQNLLRLIHDILDLSRIEAGHLEMDLQSLELGPQVGEVVTALGPLAMAKDLDLSARVAAEVPRVRADADRLRQILTNLVGNAIKFTESGMVQVTAEPRGAEVAIHVTDTGVGIPEADQAKIFQEFFQVDQTLARRQGGTGLGLAIASRLARLMGGQLSVSSVVGSGSRFTLSLPSLSAEEAAALASGPAAGEPAPRTPTAPFTVDEHRPRPSVLLVEDNEDNLFTLRQVLARLPLEIVTAASGRQAIARCRTAMPDLVILDVQMPGMSGLQATGAIRALPGGAALPIVALTAQAMKGDRERILAAGCDEYLSKPVQPKVLIELVTRLLARSAESRAQQGGPARSDSPTEGDHGAHPPRR
jgi:signal transduction histidine kinase/CheY-like chemotaxis protein